MSLSYACIGQDSYGYNCNCKEANEVNPRASRGLIKMSCALYDVSDAELGLTLGNAIATPDMQTKADNKCYKDADSICAIGFMCNCGETGSQVYSAGYRRKNGDIDVKSTDIVQANEQCKKICESKSTNKGGLGGLEIFYIVCAIILLLISIGVSAYVAL